MLNTLYLTAFLFAEAEKAAPPAGEGLGGAGQLWQFLPFLLIIVLFYFMFIRPQRSQEDKRKSMLAALKKNDRVWTIGGVYGVVVNVEREDNVATLKVDEATNAKIRVRLSAIAEVVQGESSEGSAK